MDPHWPRTNILEGMPVENPKEEARAKAAREFESVEPETDIVQ